MSFNFLSNESKEKPVKKKSEYFIEIKNPDKDKFLEDKDLKEKTAQSTSTEDLGVVEDKIKDIEDITKEKLQKIAEKKLTIQDNIKNSIFYDFFYNIIQHDKINSLQSSILRISQLLNEIPYNLEMTNKISDYFKKIFDDILKKHEQKKMIFTMAIANAFEVIEIEKVKKNEVSVHRDNSNFSVFFGKIFVPTENEAIKEALFDKLREVIVKFNDYFENKHLAKFLDKKTDIFFPNDMDIQSNSSLVSAMRSIAIEYAKSFAPFHFIFKLGEKVTSLINKKFGNSLDDTRRAGFFHMYSLAGLRPDLFRKNEKSKKRNVEQKIEPNTQRTIIKEDRVNWVKWMNYYVHKEILVYRQFFNVKTFSRLIIKSFLEKNIKEEFLKTNNTKNMEVVKEKDFYTQILNDLRPQSLKILNLDNLVNRIKALSQYWFTCQDSLDKSEEEINSIVQQKKELIGILHNAVNQEILSKDKAKNLIFNILGYEIYTFYIVIIDATICNPFYYLISNKKYDPKKSGSVSYIVSNQILGDLRGESLSSKNWFGKNYYQITQKLLLDLSTLPQWPENLPCPLEKSSLSSVSSSSQEDDEEKQQKNIENFSSNNSFFPPSTEQHSIFPKNQDDEKLLACLNEISIYNSKGVNGYKDVNEDSAESINSNSRRSTH